MQTIRIVDSHTAGEPTRVVIEGGPDLGTGSLSQRLARFQAEHDRYRRAIVNEPRGSDVMVGALLIEPDDPSCIAGIIFFNNVGYLGMCGHGTIGVIATLAHLGRIKAGTHRLQTTVGIVTATLCEDGAISVENVASYRLARSVTAWVNDVGIVKGDVAFGGNWFYLINGLDLSGDCKHEITLANLESLTTFAQRVREAVNASGYPQVDHVELFGQPISAIADSRNFVLCPGGAYDRSPCGTGTSAKLACLAAEGLLDEGEDWIQESIIGSAFAATYRWLDRGAGRILPTIHGRAHVTSEAHLQLDPADPFCWGIPR